jgi:hypothetical protein
MTRQTSKEAYEKIKANGLLSKKRFEVYSWLFLYGPATSGEVAHGVGGVRNNVASRMNELHQRGVVRESGTRKCKVSGQNTILWEVTESLPTEPEKREKPALVIKVYASGRVEASNGVKYDRASISEMAGVHKASRGLTMNGNRAMILKLWTGVAQAPNSPEDLNT